MALTDKRLLIVSGKGGVGKSTVAAALALHSARSGQRTLICEINAKERISHLLGKPEVGPQIASIDENLWAVDVRPAEAMREYALMILKFESIYNAVFENRLVRYFLRFIPSLAELVMLGKILFHLREQRPDGTFRFERIVIDAPATGHAISFLSVPQVIIDTVPPGQLSKEAEWMRDLLVDPGVTAAILVTLPEDMPVNETLELYRALQERVHVRAQAVVLNGFIGPRFDSTDLEQLAPYPALVGPTRAHEGRAQLSAHLLQKLTSELKLPVQPVPRLYLQAFGREAIEQVASHLLPLWKES